MIYNVLLKTFYTNYVFQKVTNNVTRTDVKLQVFFNLKVWQTLINIRKNGLHTVEKLTFGIECNARRDPSVWNITITITNQVPVSVL